MTRHRRRILAAFLLALSFHLLLPGYVQGKELSELLLAMPQGQCDQEAQTLLADAERSIASGGKPTRQSGWTNAHIDLMSTNGLLIAEVGREYAAAKCWNDVLRLVDSTEAGDEILARVSYLLGESGAIDEADALTAFIKNKSVLDDILERLFEQAVHRERMDIAGKIALQFVPQRPKLYSRHAWMLQSLSEEHRYDELKALCEAHWDELKPGDWIWLARAEIEGDNAARAKELIRRAIHIAPLKDRDELYLLASAITAAYLPSESLRNFRRTASPLVQLQIFETTLRQAQSEKFRNAFIKYALSQSGDKRLGKQTARCAVARFDADNGRYRKALSALKQNHCSGGRGRDPEITDAFHLEDVLRRMVRRGDTELALEWVRGTPSQYAYLFVPPVVWGLAKAGGSEEAMALIEPRTGQTLSRTLLPAVAAVLPADSPFEAWLDFALRASAGADTQEASLQALSAAFARARGPDAVLAWMGSRLDGFKRARVLVGIAEGKRGVIPGSIRPSYWSMFDE